MAAPAIAAIGCNPGGRFSLAPITAALIAPTVICPWAPMLNRPTQKAAETARPVKVSSAALVADSPHARVKTDQSPMARSDRLSAMAMKQTKSASATESNEGSACRVQGSIPVRGGCSGIGPRGAGFALDLGAHHQLSH